MLPEGFVYLVDPRIVLAMAYASEQNFVGRVIKGYQAPVCIVTEKAALALIAIQNRLDKERPGVCLKIFDAYRPMQACRDFKDWAETRDEKMKDQYYPNLSKQDIFKKGYVSERSAHARGSTVDLTLVTKSKDIQELDMGTPFDYLDPRSHTDNPDISEQARANRYLLKTFMENAGFENYPKEWWHYTLEAEPFPDTYFDFPINKSK